MIDFVLSAQFVAGILVGIFLRWLAVVIDELVKLARGKSASQIR